MNDSGKTRFDWTKFAIALMLMCSVLGFNATAQTEQEKLLNAEGVAALIQELTDGLPDLIEDEDRVTAITEKWDERKDLAGKTRTQILNLLFADVKSVIGDKETQDGIWTSWTSEEESDEETPVESPQKPPTPPVKMPEKTAVYTQTVDEIVASHVTALGGAEKLRAINSIVIEQVTPLQGMEIPSKMIIVIGRSIRSESLIMGNPMVQVVNGGKGWKIMPAMLGGSGEPEDMTAEELTPLLAQLDPFGDLYNYREKGSKVELVGKERVGNRDTIHLKITSKSGVVTDEILDAKTYLPYKRVSKAGGMESELIFSEYQGAEGIKMPKTTDIISPMGTITVLTNKIVINGKIDPQLFVKPAN